MPFFRLSATAPSAACCVAAVCRRSRLFLNTVATLSVCATKAGTLSGEKPPIDDRSSGNGINPNSLAPTPLKNCVMSKLPPSTALLTSPPIGPVSRERPVTSRLGVTNPPERSPWPAKLSLGLPNVFRNTSAALPVNPFSA